MFKKIKDFFSAPKSQKELTEVKYREIEKEFKTEITEVEPKVANKILQQVEIHGDEYQGKKLTPEIIKQNNLGPKYKVKVGETIVWFSSQSYDIGEGRIAVMAFVKQKDQVIARSYYRSNSQGVWRFLPDYETDENDNIIKYGKGYHEQSIVLPIVLQKALVEISEKDKPLKVKDPEFIMIGTARKFSWDQEEKRSTYYQEIGSSPKKLAGNFYASLSNQKLPPESLNFSNPQDKPDFSKMLTGWVCKSELYGNIKMEVFASQNAAYKYIFCRDRNKRVWISAIEDNSKTNSTGLKENWVYGGDLTTPAYEYTHQAGKYANINDKRGTYIDMFENYISRMPVIKEYCQRFNIPISGVAGREKPLKLEEARNFDDLHKVLKQLGGVQGTKDFFTAEELSDIIFKIRSGKLETDRLPRAGGLRAKVEELIAKEPKEISQTQNFEDLFLLLDRLGGLKGTKGIYKAGDLKKIIVQYLQGKVDADYITRAEGLRDKVEELAKKKAA